MKCCRERNKYKLLFNYINIYIQLTFIAILGLYGFVAESVEIQRKEIVFD